MNAVVNSIKDKLAFLSAIFVLPICRLILGGKAFNELVTQNNEEMEKQALKTVDGKGKPEANTEKEMKNQEKNILSTSNDKDKEKNKTDTKTEEKNVSIISKDNNINDVYYELVNDLSPDDKIMLLQTHGDPRLSYNELLDLYVHDFDTNVRMAVADHGEDKYLSILLKDEDEKVRNYTMNICQKYNKQYLISAINNEEKEDDFKEYTMVPLNDDFKEYAMGENNEIFSEITEDEVSVSVQDSLYDIMQQHLDMELEESYITPIVSENNKIPYFDTLEGQGDLAEEDFREMMAEAEYCDDVISCEEKYNTMYDDYDTASMNTCYEDLSLDEIIEDAMIENAYYMQMAEEFVEPETDCYDIER